MNQIRKKRLYNILLVSLFSVSGISLILYSLNSNLDYFFTPTELKEQNLCYMHYIPPISVISLYLSYLMTYNLKEFQRVNEIIK